MKESEAEKQAVEDLIGLLPRIAAWRAKYDTLESENSALKEQLAKLYASFNLYGNFDEFYRDSLKDCQKINENLQKGLAERDRYKAAAERLAEALKDIAGHCCHAEAALAPYAKTEEK